MAATCANTWPKKTWADEIHMDACSSNRELVREVVRLNTR